MKKFSLFLHTLFKIIKIIGKGILNHGSYFALTVALTLANTGARSTIFSLTLPDNHVRVTTRHHKRVISDIFTATSAAVQSVKGKPSRVVTATLSFIP